MRRFRNNWTAVWHSTGSALLLCALTTAAGFFSLTFSSGQGLRDLGAICGVGVLSAWIMSVWVLPSWSIARDAENRKAQRERPSAFYGAALWRTGIFLVRLVPENICRSMARAGGTIYRLTNPGRKKIVLKNLLPVLNNDEKKTEIATSALFQNFGEKLVDLWRFEAGISTQKNKNHWKNWSAFEVARAQKRGVLLVTIHLGNWEIGGAILAEMGVDLTVVTHPEPEGRLTNLRECARARMGIKTIVIGDDAFQFINVIRALESGATVAMLMDRPSGSAGVEVTLFERSLMVSNAAAELARATGCVILPVYVLREHCDYTAGILNEIKYVRSDLRNPEARLEIIQKIIREFEPLLRQNADQWYQFVPIWKDSGR